MVFDAGQRRLAAGQQVGGQFGLLGREGVPALLEGGEAPFELGGPGGVGLVRVIPSVFFARKRPFFDSTARSTAPSPRSSHRAAANSSSASGFTEILAPVRGASSP